MPQTQIVPLGFAGLSELDEGQIEKRLRILLIQAAQDCMNRPMDKSKRKVTLDFIFEPIADPNTGDLAKVKSEFECKAKLPVYRSRPFEMSASNSGFAFNRDFPAELDQSPLYSHGDDS